MIGSTSVRVHQHTTNQKTQPGSLSGPLARAPDEQGPCSDRCPGLPLELILTPGQAGDCPVAANLLTRLEEGTILLADKAYDADWLRRVTEQVGAGPNIPWITHTVGKPAFRAL